MACGGRFTTYERVQLRDLVVLKSNGRREDFDREKLERSVRIALQKRPIEPERIDQMVSGIVRRLESLGETDISSRQIGEIVMESLARIDTETGEVREVLRGPPDDGATGPLDESDGSDEAEGSDGAEGGDGAATGGTADGSDPGYDPEGSGPSTGSSTGSSYSGGTSN